MKSILVLGLLSVIFISGINTAFADNQLQNKNLFAESSFITLDLEFGEDSVRYGLSKDIITNTLDSVSLTFYGDNIVLSEPHLKATSTGNHFKISSIPEGIMMYGHYNDALENYKINIYLAGPDGLAKFTVNTAAQLAEDKVVETEIVEEKVAYVPELSIVTDFDFKTYWKEDFNIEVRAYDSNRNPNPEFNEFEGTLDDVKIMVFLSIDDNVVATLEGTTENGRWDGAHYFEENISAPGEYAVDVTASYLGKSISKTGPMFVIGTIPNFGSSTPPVAP